MGGVGGWWDGDLQLTRKMEEGDLLRDSSCFSDSLEREVSDFFSSDIQSNTTNPNLLSFSPSLLLYLSKFVPLSEFWQIFLKVFSASNR